jgi:hypothetical protein
VVRLDIIAGTTQKGLLSHLRWLLGVEGLPEGFKALPEDQDTWILIGQSFS